MPKRANKSWKREPSRAYGGFAEERARAPVAPPEPAQATQAVELPPVGQTPTAPRVRAKVGPGGRIVIPAPFRAAAGMEEGAEVMLTLHGEEVRVITPQAALRRVREFVRSLGPPSGNAVDEFLAERNAMWGEDDRPA